MRAAVQDRFGPPEVLRVREVETPVPGENEILIRQHATVAAQAEVAFRSGTPFIARLVTGLFKPKFRTPGDTVAGIVAAVGEGVTRFRPGDRIFGATGTGVGAYADFVRLPPDAALARMPDNMSFAEAAAIADGGLTALPFLREEVTISPGQHVLINGAVGGIGSIAVQLAKAFGAVVTGVCSTRNIELAVSLGADRVIDYTRSDFTAEGAYDVIFDTVGKSSFGRCQGILKQNGIYLTPVPALDAMLGMLSKKQEGKRARFAATGLRPAAEKVRSLEFLARVFEEGTLKAVIDRRYALEEIAAAHAYVEAGHKRGGVVIDLVPQAEAGHLSPRRLTQGSEG